MSPVLRKVLGALGLIAIAVVSGLIIHQLTKEPASAPAPSPPNLVIHIEDRPFPLRTEEPQKPGVFFFREELEVANTFKTPAVESTITTRTYTGYGWLDRVYGNKQTIVKGHPVRRTIRAELSANPGKDLCLGEVTVLSQVKLHWEDEDGNNYDGAAYIQYLCERHFSGPNAPYYFRWVPIGNKPPAGVPEPPP